MCRNFQRDEISEIIRPNRLMKKLQIIFTSFSHIDSFLVKFVCNLVFV